MLALWAAGVALCTAAIAYATIVGPGYLWLSSAIVLLFGVGAAWAGGNVPAIVGAACVALAAVFARRRSPATALFGAAATAFGVAALGDSPPLPIVTGALLLGGITTEMVLGHWYLIDPRLPRRALLRLDLVGGIGLVLDLAYVAGRGGLGWEPADSVIGWAYVALAAMTLLLLFGVWFSLREPSYTGVMAATGLSYLAVLTAFGVTVLGRSLIDVGPTTVLRG